MKGTLLFAAIIWLSGTTLTFAEPDFPKGHVGTYGKWSNANCKQTEDGWICRPPKEFNGVVVAPAAGGRTRVWLFQSGVHSSCEFDGLRNWNGNELIASRTNNDPDAGGCDLAVKFEKNTLTTTGKSPGCVWGCGSWINVRRAPKLSSRTAIPPKQ